jgi:ceramide glucosyltransferase
MMIILIAWSIAAFVWWTIALVLLAQARRWQRCPTRAQRPSITVFKPLPPVSQEHELTALVAAIESFVSQMTSADQLLIGINAQDESIWQTPVQRWRTTGSPVRIEVVVQPAPTHCANPKIAWQQVLAERAQGEMWLWSDADVTAPPGFLDALARQLMTSDCNAVTAPYCIRRIGHGHEALDALIVNVEFLPGTLLLGQLKRNNFAYGAATLFRVQAFRQRVDWRQLGAALADDYKLGEQLQPVLLARSMASTFSQPSGWSAAWQHYYRWQKTVRWCQPGGFAALLILMPVFGWSAAGWFGVEPMVQLGGLATVLAGEMLVALAACSLMRCCISITALPGVLLWPFTRPIVWLLVWLPLPVLWSGRQRAWFAPEQD